MNSQNRWDSMSESIPVSTEIKNQLHQIKKPGETYEDVIAKLLKEHREEIVSDICEGWATRAGEAVAEYQRGETLTEDEIMRKYNVT